MLNRHGSSQDRPTMTDESKVVSRLRTGAAVPPNTLVLLRLGFPRAAM